MFSNYQSAARESGAQSVLKRSAFGFLTAAIMTMATSPALAQEADTAAAKSGPKIETVMVTARKTSESVQDIPMAVTALTTELESATIRNLTDLNAYAPNVRIATDPSRGNAAAITIRGISATRTDDNSFDSPIAVMIDGIYLGSLAGQVLENFDMERIEVLRGPQGTLYGRNTVGGVVSAVRTRPTGEFGAKLQYTFGKWDQHEIRAVFNTPMVEDKLAFKGFFTSLQRDGYYKNTFLDSTQPQKDYMNYGGTFLFTPTDDFEAVFTVERFVDNSQGGAYLTNWNFAPGVVPATGSDQDPNYAGGFLACLIAEAFSYDKDGGAPLANNVPCRTDLDFPKDEIRTDFPNTMHVATTAYTLDMSYDLNDNLNLVSVFGYRKMTENRKQDFDGTEVDHITLQRNNEYDQFSAEVRLEGSWDKVNALLGYYFWNSEFEQQWVTGGEFGEFTNRLGGYSLGQNFWTGTGSPVLAGLYSATHTPLEACRERLLGNSRCDEQLFDDVGNVGYGPGQVGKLYETQETTAHAIFANADWEFAEGWTIEAGVRWSYEKKEFTAGQAYRTPLSTLTNGVPFRDGFNEFAVLEKSWSDVSPKASIRWQPSDDMMVYVSFAEGWHSGGFFGVNQNIADFERDQYEPETSQSFELGMKAQWLDNRLQTNLTFFRNNFKNKQESAVQFDDTTNTVATVFSNVADVTYQGVELEINAVITEALVIFTNVGYLDAQYGEFFTDINPTDTCAGAPECLEDASFLSPRNSPEWTGGAGFTYTVMIGNGDDLAFDFRWTYTSTIEGGLLNQTYSRVPSRNDISAAITYSGENWSVSLFGKNLLNERFEAPTIIQPLFATGTVGPGASWGIQVGGEF
jgi:iron complex outermembrane recepter protein